MSRAGAGSAARLTGTRGRARRRWRPRGPSGSRPCPPGERDDVVHEDELPWGACSGRGARGRGADELLGGQLVAGSRSCTTATTSWPQRSLGRPTTTTSYTSGWRAMACSTSSAKIFSPPELMVTESRPRSSIEAVGAAAGPGRRAPSSARPSIDRERARGLVGVAEVAERHAAAAGPASRSRRGRGRGRVARSSLDDDACRARGRSVPVGGRPGGRGSWPDSGRRSRTSRRRR